MVAGDGHRHVLLRLGRQLDGIDLSVYAIYVGLHFSQHNPTDVSAQQRQLGLGFKSGFFDFIFYRLHAFFYSFQTSCFVGYGHFLGSPLKDLSYSSLAQSLDNVVKGNFVDGILQTKRPLAEDKPNLFLFLIWAGDFGGC